MLMNLFTWQVSSCELQVFFLFLFYLPALCSWRQDEFSSSLTFFVTVPGILNILTSVLTVEVQFIHLLFSPYEREQGVQLPKKEVINVFLLY